MYVGVIGSDNYRDKKMVFKLIITNTDTNDIIVSGHSPSHDNDNVDNWAEEFCKKYSYPEPKIHPPKTLDRDGFFNRNTLIANDSEKLIAFINIGTYRSGTWNTINTFAKKENFNSKNLLIYDENGLLWDKNKLPRWLIPKV